MFSVIVVLMEKDRGLEVFRLSLFLMIAIRGRGCRRIQVTCPQHETQDLDKCIFKSKQVHLVARTNTFNNWDEYFIDRGCRRNAHPSSMDLTQNTQKHKTWTNTFRKFNKYTNLLVAGAYKLHILNMKFPHT